MNSIALVTGADRGLGLALVAELLTNGWQTIAGQYMPDWPELDKLSEQYPNQLTIVPLDVASDESVRRAAKQTATMVDHIDLLINNAGVNSPTSYIPLEEPQDFSEMQRLYNVNSLGPLRVVNAFLSLIEAGDKKRLCFVSSEAGSIERAHRNMWFGYGMSKAALNMGIKLLFNRLRPDGFRFRVYHPGWVQSYIGGKFNERANLTADDAARLALGHFLRDTLNGQPIDEDRLVMVGWQGEEWPW